MDVLRVANRCGHRRCPPGDHALAGKHHRRLGERWPLALAAAVLDESTAQNIIKPLLSGSTLIVSGYQKPTTALRIVKKASSG